jgi:hypothetical protein
MYTLVTLPRNVTSYRDSVDGTFDHVTYQKFVTRLHYGLVRCAVSMWSSHQRDDTVTAWASVDGQRDTSPPSTASCKDIAQAPLTNWEPQCVTLAGYCYAVRQGMKVQLVTPYRVSLLQRYSVTLRGNVTSVYPPLPFTVFSACYIETGHTFTFKLSILKK